jgi:hypothetical protein
MEKEDEDEECCSNRGFYGGRGRRGRGLIRGGRGCRPPLDAAEREREKINANPDAKFSDNVLMVKNIPATYNKERV